MFRNSLLNGPLQVYQLLDHAHQDQAQKDLFGTLSLGQTVPLGNTEGQYFQAALGLFHSQSDFVTLQGSLGPLNPKKDFFFFLRESGLQTLLRKETAWRKCELSMGQSGQLSSILPQGSTKSVLSTQWLGAVLSGARTDQNFDWKQEEDSRKERQDKLKDKENIRVSTKKKDEQEEKREAYQIEIEEEKEEDPDYSQSTKKTTRPNNRHENV